MYENQLLNSYCVWECVHAVCEWLFMCVWERWVVLNEYKHFASVDQELDLEYFALSHSQTVDTHTILLQA